MILPPLFTQTYENYTCIYSTDKVRLLKQQSCKLRQEKRQQHQKVNKATTRYDYH